MTAQLIDGNAISRKMRTELAQKTAAFAIRHGREPGLAVILVGDSAASALYVQKKKDACAAAGIRSTIIRLPADCPAHRLLDQIAVLNSDDAVDGILVQLPLPLHLDPAIILEAVDAEKDVDGFHPCNVGRLALREPALRPCTPAGVMTLLEASGIPVLGREAVVVGASNIVGRPMALELLLAGATVTVCHRFTRDLPSHVRRAEILVAAAGNPGLIRGEWIAQGAAVIDVGINRLPDGRLSGDVEFTAAAERAGWITPVPGGVGPMTVTTLLQNTLTAATRREERRHRG